MANIHVTKWALTSPIPVISIVAVYFYVVCSLGPQIMKNRNAYSLKKFMQLYNIFQVIYNVWLLSSVIKYSNPIDSILNYCDSLESSETQLEIIWWGLLLKIIDLLDTVLFVLRKNTRQITYLHLYHHSSTIFYVWINLRYIPHRSVLTLIWINTTVHTLMYSYYFLSTFGPNVQRMLQPCKKWITVIQMVQIAFLMFNSLQGLTCDRNVLVWSVLSFINAAINLSFFWNFFSKAYVKSKTT